MELRQYQKDIINNVKKEILDGKKSICVVLGCGGGKSIIQAMISKMATLKGNRVLFLVHRKELCEQIEETFAKCGVDFNLCDIGMVQTVTRRLKDMYEPQIIITDENHHCLAKTYTDIYDYFPNAIRLGFTATPMRMNEGGLGKVYESMVEGVSVTWLIENKYLSTFTVYSKRLADASDIKVSRGDYKQDDLASLMEENVIYGETIKNYQKIAMGKKTIVYCSSVVSSKETSKEFNENGIVAAHLDGNSSKAERKDIIDKFRNGEITVLCNVDLFGEGFDVPDCECIILLRPTKSLTLYIQQSMRSMRYKENKHAIIIDHVGNVFEHGFPDEDREWSLETKKKKKKSQVKIKECPECFACLPVNVRLCTYCRYEFFSKEVEAQKKKIIEMELQEITRKNMLSNKPYKHYLKIKTFADMQAFQIAKGYKISWTIHKCIELGIEIPSKYDYMRRFLKQ
jgi:superfamily II DNA or RNA helicase